MTTPEILIIITTSSAAVSSIFNSFFNAKRGQVKNVQDTVADIHTKAAEIKTQTDGNHSELIQKIDILLSENTGLREKNVTLEKAMIALTATSQPAQRPARSTDLVAKDVKPEDKN